MQRSIDVRPPAVPGRGGEPVPTRPEPRRTTSTQPMARSSRKKTHGLATLVTVGLALVLVATVGGLYVFGPGQRAGEVMVEVEAPLAVTSGDEVTYVVTVTNSDAALDVADLTLEYPVGFIVSATNPPAANAAGQSLFQLAPLEAGGQATVSVTGRLLGSIGTAAEIRARLDYEPVNFSSSFHVEGAAVTSISASRISLAFQAPTTAVSPGVLALSIRVENVSSVTMNDTEIVLEVPEGVSVTSSTPPLASSSGELRYDLGTLEPGGSWSAELAAEVVGDGGSRRGLAVAAYQRIGGQRVIVDRALREVEVVQPSAAVELSANQSTSSSSAAAGATVPVAVGLSNTGQATLAELTVRLRLAGPVDWDRLQAGEARRDGDALVWQVGSAEAGATLGSAVDISIRGDAQAGESVLLVATVTSAAYGEDWQAAAGPISIVVQ